MRRVLIGACALPTPPPCPCVRVASYRLELVAVSVSPGLTSELNTTVKMLGTIFPWLAENTSGLAGGPDGAMVPTTTTASLTTAAAGKTRLFSSTPAVYLTWA